MRTRALRGRADVQADERRPCRRCMAAVNLSVDATVYIMHRSQAIHCLYIGSSPDVRAHGYTHCSKAFLRSPSDLPEPPVQRVSRFYVLTRCKQKPFLAVIAIASHDSLGTSTRAGSTARSYDLTTGFFAQPRLEYQIERVLLIDRCRVRSCAMDARYERRHLERRLPSENERIHGFLCAYRRLRILRDLLQQAVAARRPVCIVRFTHVIASLRGRIRRPGATCTAA